jgi:multiple sugar transport system permease protein
VKQPIGWFTGKNAGRAFLTPTVVILLVLTIFPFLFTIFLTFSDVSMKGGIGIELIGGRNWSRLWQDERFWNGLVNTLMIVAVGVPIQYVLGMGLAVLLNTNLRGTGFFRVLFFIPMMLTPIAIGYLWRMMYNPSRGPLADLFQALGFQPVEWLTNNQLAIFAIIIADIWHWTPFMILLLYAGLQNVPEHLNESARIAGANAWQRFIYVTFPMLMPSTVAAVLIRALTAFVYVDKIYIMTGGGPGIETETLTLYGYQIGLGAFDLAYGAVIAVSLFLVALVFSVIFLLATAKSTEIQVE